MNYQPTIISYRSSNDQYSQFINVDELLETNNLDKITKIYEDIFTSVTAYDPQHSKIFKKVENALFERIKVLKDEKREDIEKNWGVKNFFVDEKNNDLINKNVNQKENLLQNIQLKFSHAEKIHAKFQRAFSQMVQRAQKKVVHEKPQFLIELERRRLSDPNQELRRLESYPRIAKSLKNLREFGIPNNKKEVVHLSISQEIAFAHSLELQEELKNTHYVFNHGQNLQFIVKNIITRLLEKEFNPKYYESFERLRHIDSSSNIDKLEPVEKWYAQKEKEKGMFFDHVYRDELISADCFLESTTMAESALSFFAVCDNILLSKKDKKNKLNIIFNLILNIAEKYITDPQVARKLSNDLTRIWSKYAAKEGNGNLYSICIPKHPENFLRESSYFSHPFGIPFDNQDELIQKLDELQSGVGENDQNIPQIRILASQIQPENGFHVVLNSTLTDEQLKQIEDEVSIGIQTALTNYRIDQNKIESEEKLLNDIEDNYTVFEIVDEKLKFDRNFVLKAIERNAEVLKCIDKSFLRDPEIISKAFQTPEVAKDQELILTIIPYYPRVVELINPSLKKDKPFIAKCLNSDAKVLEFLLEPMRNTLELAIIAVKQNYEFFQFVGNEIKSNPKLLNALIEANPKILLLQEASDLLKKEIGQEEKILAEIEENYQSFESLDLELKLNREFVLKAIERNGEVIRSVSENFWKDPEIIAKAFNSSKFKNYENDGEFILKIIPYYPKVVELISEELKMRLPFIVKALEIDGTLLEYFPYYQNSIGIVMTAVTQNHEAFRFASAEIKSNPVFLQALVEANPKILTL